MISPSTPFRYYAPMVHLATSTGIEVFQDGLHSEASYHYELALQHIIKMQEQLDETNDHQQAENRDCQEMTMSHTRGVCVARLGEPVMLSPLPKMSGFDAPESGPIEQSWIQCSSIVLLHNFALLHLKIKHCESAKALLNLAILLLASEIDEKPLTSATFYEDPQNVALAMSLHFLMANMILKEGQQCSAAGYDRISNDKIVEAAALECGEAISLADKYIQVDARNGLFVAPVVSLLGYCVMSMSYANRDIQDALSLYQTATTLYNGYRGEAETTRAPLAETDKTKNSLRPEAIVAADEVAACAA
jgi:hypothetical protein